MQARGDEWSGRHSSSRNLSPKVRSADSDGGCLEYSRETREGAGKSGLIDAGASGEGIPASAGRGKSQSIDRSPRLLVLHDTREWDTEANRDNFLPLSRTAEERGFVVGHLQVTTIDDLRKMLREFSPDMIACASFPQEQDFVKRAQSLLEGTHVALIGPSPASIGKTRYLPTMRAELEAWKLPVHKWQVIHPDSDGEIRDLATLEALVDFPYFVRPALRTDGSSDKGLTASFSAELYYAVYAYCKSKQDVVIEHVDVDLPDCRHYLVSMLGSGATSIVAPAEVMVPEGGKDRRFTKNREDAIVFSPVSDPVVRGRITRLARRSFDALGVTDYGQCLVEQRGNDLFILDVDCQPYIHDEGFWRCFSTMGINQDNIAIAVLYACLVACVAEGKGLFSALFPLRKCLPGEIITRLESA